MKIDKLREIISQNNWNDIVSTYSSKNICSLLDFKEVMQLANNLFGYWFNFVQWIFFAD